MIEHSKKPRDWGPDHDLWLKSFNLARLAHRGQRRKFGDNEEYINHPLRVAMKVSWDPILTSAALLHDVVEDSSYTLYDIEQVAGERVAELVDLLTRRKDENYFRFLMRTLEDRDACRIKLADISDNLDTLPEEGSLPDKYRLAMYILLQRLSQDLSLWERIKRLVRR